MNNFEKGKIDIICSLVLLVGSVFLFSQGSISLSTYLSQKYMETDIAPGKSTYSITAEKEQIGVLSLEFSNTQKLSLDGSGTLMLANKNAEILVAAQANLLGQVQSGIIEISTEDERISVILTGISPIHLTTTINTPENQSTTTEIYSELLELQSQNGSGVRFSHNTIPRYIERALQSLTIELKKAPIESSAFSQSSSHISWKRLKKAFLKEQMKEQL